MSKIYIQFSVKCYGAKKSILHNKNINLLKATYIIWGPGLIFGVMCLLAGALLTRLPETRGYELPDSMEELSGWYKSMKIREKYKKEETNVQFHVER